MKLLLNDKVVWDTEDNRFSDYFDSVAQIFRYDIVVGPHPRPTAVTVHVGEMALTYTADDSNA